MSGEAETSRRDSLKKARLYDSASESSYSKSF
jgi:hypothetical protein